MKVDLVMWTKNGSRTLPQVLKRIGEVIPKKFVNQSLIIDDDSIDDTREIAQAFGWRVILNEGTGISDGANTALKHVDSDCFISFEQDLLLAKDWWFNIPSVLEKDKVVVASGIRMPDKPFALRRLQEYVTEIYRAELNFLYGKTLDNTIYQTDIIRKIGGFPKLNGGAGVDTVLAKELLKHGYCWNVNYDVRSIHLREGLFDELKRNYWYGVCQKEINKAVEEKGVKWYRSLRHTAFSPFRGTQVAYRQGCWQIVYVYPLIRLVSFFGIMRGYSTDFTLKKRRNQVVCSDNVEIGVIEEIVERANS